MNLFSNKRPIGFTLVELLVAMFLTAILGVLAYALFATTSDNLSEVDSLEATSSRTRFAVERMRKLFQSAASGGTPDSTLDPFVQPRDEMGLPYQISGFYPYTNWQDDTTAYGPGIAAANPWVSLDGVVIAGAFDFPTSFEASGFEQATQNRMTIKGHYRGMERLAVPDPFSDAVAPVGPGIYRPALDLTRDWGDANSYDFFQKNFTTRIVRLTDPQGYTQFVAPGATFVPGDVQPGTPWNYVNITLDAVGNIWGPQFKDPNRADHAGPPYDDLNMSELGLDIATDNEGDRSYDAMFIDMFWLHVIQSPTDPSDLQLVMERLCAKDFAEAAGTDISNANPANFVAGGGDSCVGSEPERFLISDRVVDFQVWFDCANANRVIGGVPVGFELQNNTNWTRDWVTPDHTVDDLCYDRNPMTFVPGRARAAHMRLTLRTASERPSLRHYQFETGAGVCNDPTVACPGASLKTFDPYPNLQGATPVVTVQSDVQLYNYAIRDL